MAKDPKEILNKVAGLTPQQVQANADYKAGKIDLATYNDRYISKDVPKNTPPVFANEQPGYYDKKVELPVQPELPVQQPPVQAPIDNSAQLKQLLDFAKNSSESYLTSQKAQLKQTLDVTLANLEKSYNQAVMDGELSVKDAQTQFEAKKKEIERLAYQDAERTGLYSQGAGIGNSNQSIALQQGDNARTNERITTGIAERDTRINEVKDRIKNITLSKNLDTTTAQSGYNTGLLKAGADAQNQYNTNAMGILSQDYFTNKQNQFELGKLDLQNKYAMEQIDVQNEFDLSKMGTQLGIDLEKMATAQGYNTQNMTLQQKYDLTKMGENFSQQQQLVATEFENRITQMKIQQGFDVAKMNAGFANDLRMVGVSDDSKIKLLEKQYELENKQIKDKYDTELAQALRGVTPGTPEYNIIQGNYERDLKNALTQNHATNIQEIQTNEILLSPVSSSDYKDATSFLDKFGASSNPIYNTSKSEAQATIDAYKRYQEFMNSGSKYSPYNP